jgi:hypothetical protein
VVELPRPALVGLTARIRDGASIVAPDGHPPRAR